METSVSDRVDNLGPLPQKHTWHKHMKNCVFLFTEHSDVLENNQKSNILALFVPPPGGKRLPRSDTHSGDVDCSSVKVWTHPLDVLAEGLAEARAEDLKLDVGVGAVVLKVHRTCQTCDISLKRRVADREERDGGLEVTQDDLCSPSDTIRLFPEPSDAPLSSFIMTIFSSSCYLLYLLPDYIWLFQEQFVIRVQTRHELRMTTSCAIDGFMLQKSVNLPEQWHRQQPCFYIPMATSWVVYIKDVIQMSCPWISQWDKQS